MKKILAILTALVLALSCTLALAEADGGFAGLTITSEAYVNREVLADALTALGAPQEIAGVADTVAAVLDELGERFVVDNGGAEYALSLKGRDVLVLSGEATDEGFALASNLFPNTVLTLSYAAIGEMLEGALGKAGEAVKALEDVDMNAAIDAVSGYVSEFVDDLSAAIVPGEPEQGEYDIEGYTFNAKMPLNVDVEAIVAAMNALTEKLDSDEAVQSAIQTLQGLGVNVEIAGPVSAEELPAADVNIYMVLDENGDAGETSCVTALLTDGESSAEVKLLMDGKDVLVKAGVPGETDGITFAWLPNDDGAYARLDVNVQGIYFGLATTQYCTDSLGADFDVYLMNEETPLLGERVYYQEGGERTLAVDTAGKTLLDVTVLADSEGEAMNSLQQDVMNNGVAAVLGAALEALPDEIGALMNLFQANEVAA